MAIDAPPSLTSRVVLGLAIVSYGLLLASIVGFIAATMVDAVPLALLELP
jgi:hypothetical protein